MKMRFLWYSQKQKSYLVCEARARSFARFSECLAFHTDLHCNFAFASASSLANVVFLLFLFEWVFFNSLLISIVSSHWVHDAYQFTFHKFECGNRRYNVVIFVLLSSSNSFFVSFVTGFTIFIFMYCAFFLSFSLSLFFRCDFLFYWNAVASAL